MAVIYVADNIGRTFPVKIDGDTPSPTEQARIDSFLAQKNSEFPAQNAPAEEPGFFDRMGTSAKSLGVDLQSAAAGAGLMDDPAAARAALAKEQAAQPGFMEQMAAGNPIDAITGLVADQIPQMLPGVGGGVAGAGVGGMLGGPIGAGIGALVGGFAGSYPQMAGANRERQIQEGILPAQVDEWAAFGTAVPQAALDSLVNRFLPGAGKILNIDGSLTQVGEELVKQGVLRPVAKRTTEGLATEAGTEVAQQAMERAQAGLDVISPEAGREYLEAGLAGGILGGGIGGYGAYADRRTAVKGQEAEQAAFAQADADLKAEAPETLRYLEMARKWREEEAMKEALPAPPKPDIAGLLPPPKADKEVEPRPNAEPPPAPGVNAPEVDPFAVDWQNRGKTPAQVFDEVTESDKQGWVPPPPGGVDAREDPYKAGWVGNLRQFRPENYFGPVDPVVAGPPDPLSVAKITPPANSEAPNGETRVSSPIENAAQIRGQEVKRGISLIKPPEKEPETRPFPEADYQRVVEAIKKNGRVNLPELQKQTGINIGRLKEITQAATERGQLVRENAKKLKPFEQISPNRQQTPVTEDAKTDTVAGIDRSDPGTKDYAVVKGRRQKPEWQVFDPKGTPVGQYVTRDEAAKAGKSIKGSKIKANYDTYATMEYRRGADGNVMTQAPVASFRTQEEADADVRQRRGEPEPVKEQPAAKAGDSSTPVRGVSREKAREQKLSPARKKLQERMEAYGLTDIAGKVVGVVDGTTDRVLVKGRQTVKDEDGKKRNVVEVAAGIYDSANDKDAKSLDRTIDEELFHAAKADGLFTDEEYARLKKVAATRKVNGKNYTYKQWARRAYGDRVNNDMDVIEEEGVAKLFVDTINDPDIEPEAKGVFGRVRNVAKALFETFASDDGKDLIDAFKKGDIGKRPRQRGETKTRESYSAVDDDPEPTDIDTPEFRRFFGKSKVVDKEGNPLVVYHHGDFGEGDNFSPNGPMHFGTKAAAEERAVAKRKERAFEDVSTYESDDGWHWDDGATTSEEAGYGPYNSRDAALQGGHKYVAKYLSGETYFYDDDVKETGNMTPAYLSIQNPKRVPDQHYDWSNAIEEAKEEGHDGIVYRNLYEDKGSDSYIIFEPEQAKSIYNKGTWSSLKKDIRYSMSYVRDEDLGQRIPPVDVQQVANEVTYNNVVGFIQRMAGKSYLSPEAQEKLVAFAEKAQVKLQDRMIPIGRMIDEIRKGGGVVTDDMNTYAHEERMVGVVGALIKNRENGIYKTLVESVKALGFPETSRAQVEGINDTAKKFLSKYKNLNRGIADLYIYAKAAPGRNERIAAMKGGENGSGMSTEDARQITAYFERPGAPHVARIREMYKAFRDVIDDTNKTRERGGLNPIDLQGEEFYAPLRGHLDDEDPDPVYPKTGKGLGAQGREDKRATGRSSFAANLMENAIHQNVEAQLRAEKNIVAQTFARMVEANPDNGFAEIVERLPMKKVIRKTKNGPTIVWQSDSSYRADEGYFIFKEDGKEVVMKIHDPAVAQAMNGTGVIKDPGLFLRYFGMLNRFLAAVNTSYNPEFLFSNAPRDVQTALINAGTAGIPGLRKAIWKNYRKNAGTVWKALHNNDYSGANGAMFKEFEDMGGLTLFQGDRSLESIVKGVDKHFEDESKLKSAKYVKEGFMKLGRLVEHSNETVENLLRFASYKAAVEKGMSKKQALEFSKNLTVNFNKGGEWKNTANAMYLFYNASIQGTFAMLNAMRSPAVRKAWVTVIGLGLAQELLMSSLAPDDKDGENVYDKIEDWIKERNLIVLTPFTERGYISIPMPYGFNAAFGLGRQIGLVMRGEKDPMAAAGTAAAGIFNAISPIGELRNVVNMVSPTVLDPVVDVFATNRNFAGNPIVPEQSPYGVPKPDSQRYTANTSPAFVAVADWLNQTFGGSDVVSAGLMDISPSSMQYTLDFSTGAAGATAVRFMDNVTDILTGNFVNRVSEDGVRQVTLIRKFMGSVSESTDLNAYLDRVNKVLTAEKDVKVTAESGDIEGARGLVKKYQTEIQVVRAIRQLESERNKIQTMIRKLERSGLPETNREELIKRLKEQRRTIVIAGNAIFNKYGIAAE